MDPDALKPPLYHSGPLMIRLKPWAFSAALRRARGGGSCRSVWPGGSPYVAAPMPGDVSLQASASASAWSGDRPCRAITFFGSSVITGP